MKEEKCRTDVYNEFFLSLLSMYEDCDLPQLSVV